MIIQKGKTREVNADSIRVGECFLYRYDLYMRTTADFVGPENLNSWPVRCVRMKDGMLNGLGKNNTVISVNATITHDE